MDASEVFATVIESAARFGARNPQQFKLLLAKLAKCNHDVLFDGLLMVFAKGPSEFEVQELAGALLAQLAPTSMFDLEAALLAVGENYNLSIEQLPFHFAKIHGKEATREVITKLLTMQQTEKSRRSLETMSWWIRGNEKAAQSQS